MDNITEAKITDDVLALADGIRKADPVNFSNVSDATLANCINICCEDSATPKEELTVEAFLDWFSLSDSIAEFIFDFADELYTHSIADLGKESHAFKNAVLSLAKKQRFIDDEMHDLTYPTDGGGYGSTITFERLIYNLFEEACKRHDGKVIPSMRKDMVQAIRDEYEHESRKPTNPEYEEYVIENLCEDVDFEDEEYLANAKIYADQILNGSREEAENALLDYDFENQEPGDEAEEIIYNAIKKRLDMSESLDEDTEELPAEVEVEEPADVEEPVAEVNAEEINEPTNDTLIDAAAFGETINSVIKAEWELISELNSVLATIKLSYNGENKDDIEKVLNSLLDDHTIDVGMLYKVYDLLGNKTSDLLDAGTEKAEEIISEPATDLE